MFTYKFYIMRLFILLLVFNFFMFLLVCAKPIRVGVAGMTHNHINQVFDYMGKQDEIEIVHVRHSARRPWRGGAHLSPGQPI